jgi:hypothetical protein
MRNFASKIDEVVVQIPALAPPDASAVALPWTSTIGRHLAISRKAGIIHLDDCGKKLITPWAASK